MPNLKELLKLKTKYGETQAGLTVEKVNLLLEAFDPVKIEKGFSQGRIEQRTFSFTTGFVNNYKSYFQSRKKVNAVLLFIDITGFSKRFISKSAEEVAEYLDEYYNHVMPVLEKYEGVVEKVIGDGIICVFGEPFLELTKRQLHRKAERCSCELINGLVNTDFEVKIAFHFGEIMYYQNECSDYWEYTMIGNALTDLFRLEGVSKPNSINFFSETYYEWLNVNDIQTKRALQIKGKWEFTELEKIQLQGVIHSHIRSLKIKSIT
ncbi:MAG TPA: adenylate/guanylate cyclase domain-containing protein [Sediminibacterium sp.]|nr:adenylate/guanylate cyclase domain-containing protein [Sediminibacterium sp.]